MAMTRHALPCKSSNAPCIQIASMKIHNVGCQDGRVESGITRSSIFRTCVNKRVKKKQLLRSTGHGNHVDRETNEARHALNKDVRVENALFEYIIDHSREDDVLRELRHATAERFPRAAKMAVGPEQGAFLGWLVDLMSVRMAVEIGVFTGYSSICIAKAMSRQRPDATLFALDRDPVAMETAREFWKRSGVDDIIKARCGNALESLNDISKTYGENSFDFAFVDANKRGYRDYYDMLLPMMRVGGVIAIDNVLWYGKVADESVTDATTESLRALNRHILEDDRVTMTLAPIGDGILLCTKRDTGHQSMNE